MSREEAFAIVEAEFRKLPQTTIHFTEGSMCGDWYAGLPQSLLQRIDEAFAEQALTRKLRQENYVKAMVEKASKR